MQYSSESFFLITRYLKAFNRLYITDINRNNSKPIHFLLSDTVLLSITGKLKKCLPSFYLNKNINQPIDLFFRRNTSIIMATNDDVVIKRGRGYIGAFGPRIETLANEVATTAGITTVPSSPYHITLITKDELHQLTTDLADKIDELYENATTIDSKHIYSLGLGGDPKGVCWVVIIWNAGNIFRKKYGLSFKQFHITLSNNDDHSLDKSLYSSHELFSMENLNLNLIDHLVLSYNLSDQYDQALIYAREMCRRFPDSEKGWLRLADIARRNQQYKLAMLAYAQTIQLVDNQRNEKIQEYCTKKILNCVSNYTEWECLFREDELEQIPEELRINLFAPWTQTIRQRFINIYTDEQPQYQQMSRDHILIPFVDRRRTNEDLGKYSYFIRLYDLQ